MNKKYLETYSNFLIASTKSAHSTDLQKITDSEFSKDSVYRFLSSGQFCEKTIGYLLEKLLDLLKILMLVFLLMILLSTNHILKRMKLLNITGIIL